MDDGEIKDFVLFQLQRQTTNLFKQFLVILEDVQKDNPLFTEESFNKHRKRILDLGNDMLRDTETLLEKVDVQLKSSVHE